MARRLLLHTFGLILLLLLALPPALAEPPELKTPVSSMGPVDLATRPVEEPSLYPLPAFSTVPLAASIDREAPGSAASSSSASVRLWVIERADAPKLFRWLGDHSLAADTDGHLHVAYGADHLYYAWNDGSSWHLETVDDAWGVGRYSSLALDTNNRPHISYFDQTQRAVKYAYDDGSTWHIETVESNLGYYSGYTSLDVDAAGRPHISYAEAIGGDIRYAYHDGTTWHIETVDDSGGRFTSLALDTAGRPHISYLNDADTALKHAWHDGTTWHTETVDTDGYPGWYSSLALGIDDSIHISYYEDTSYDLRYARFDGASWMTETVVSTGTVGWSSSIALDPAGYPHISYYDLSNSDIRHAYFDGASWHTEPASGMIYLMNGYTTLAIDTLGNPHVVYIDYEYWKGELVHAYHDGAQWNSETVDLCGWVGYCTSLALDSQGYPHISYRDRIRSNIRYARYDGTSWQTEMLDNLAGFFGDGYTSLALDASDLPRIGYWGSGELRYAYHDGSNWQIETVDDQQRGGSFASLVLDGILRPHISYYFETAGDLRYARHDGTNWITETVDSIGDVGWYTSLALDSSGLPHISYQDYGNRDLKYARFDGGTWVTETVDSVGDVGRHTSLVLDPSDHPHVCYYDRTNYSLKYALYNGASWQFEVVDSGLGYYGGHSSLVLDANGHPHISYFDNTNHELRYAYHDGTSWQIEVLDEGLGEYGGYTSLVLDAAGLPHISYYDDTNADLKYAYAIECTVLEGVDPTGPTFLQVGETGIYTAAYRPPTATLPVTLLWDSGVEGPTAAYSWTMPGIYTVTVTATNPCAQVSASLTVNVCQPVENVEISGPAMRFTGQPGTYTAAALPITASTPITYTWDNGTIGPTAVYSWTTPGTYTLTVTASNPCGTITGTYAVLVSDCRPVTGAEIEGPALLPAGIDGLFTATPTPITASTPITYTWDNGTVSQTAAYSWTLPGTYTVVVTAANYCGQGQASTTVTVFCQPLLGVQVNGPTLLPAGLTGLYSVTYSPITASRPLTFTWSNGAVGATAPYSWTLPGTYTVVVTAANSCSQVQDTLIVEVTCQPLEAAGIDGPHTLLMDETGLYTATYAPLTASLPLTLTWDNGAVGPVVTYSWSTPGDYAIHLTATNLCGPVLTATQAVTVLYGTRSTIYPTMAGTLVFTDIQGNPTSVYVPVGAVTETTTLVYLAVGSVSPPAGLAFAGHAFDLDAYRDGVLLPSFPFLRAVTVTIHYAATDVYGIDEQSLVLNYRRGDDWFDAVTTCGPGAVYDRHPEENWLRLPICHLSRFALFGVKQQHIFLPLVSKGA